MDRCYARDRTHGALKRVTENSGSVAVQLLMWDLRVVRVSACTETDAHILHGSQPAAVWSRTALIRMFGNTVQDQDPGPDLKSNPDFNAAPHFSPDSSASLNPDINGPEFNLALIPGPNPYPKSIQVTIVD